MLSCVCHVGAACSAAVGAWSGQLFGLVQDLTAGDGAVDGLALAYADEQRILDNQGNVKQLILQMQVRAQQACAYVNIHIRALLGRKGHHKMQCGCKIWLLWVHWSSASKGVLQTQLNTS